MSLKVEACVTDSPVGAQWRSRAAHEQRGSHAKRSLKCWMPSRRTRGVPISSAHVVGGRRSSNCCQPVGFPPCAIGWHVRGTCCPRWFQESTGYVFVSLVRLLPAPSSARQQGGMNFGLRMYLLTPNQPYAGFSWRCSSCPLLGAFNMFAIAAVAATLAVFRHTPRAERPNAS